MRLMSKKNKVEIETISTIGRKFSDSIIRMHEAVARKAGLSGTDHKYLGLIIRQGEMTAGELARQTGLTTGAVTGLIDRLEAKELVTRAFNKNDRRKIMIVPNQEKAMALLAPIFAGLQNKMMDLISNLTEQEKQIIETYLLSAMQIMDDVTDNLK
jgi:DNA-binding MarR family transcriptional regulator